ncbi:MAG TPA: hypothetical protein VJT49_18745 [Amycolatopsis sp.]|uniref:hypothetical protein n=1 Tax=Amycolatopsis sp. TaxID=37632 RepID=UPI002B464D4E|nr:hypothetical protein [Amycolatopsis sp.]HKS47105.1 hypothetical protein [Amycolatopsis sp.]
MNRQNYAWLFTQQGPLNLAAASKVLSLSVDYFRDGRSKPLVAVRSAMYPSVEVVTAARLLFGVYTGVVPDGIRDLGLDDVTWTGDEAAVLEYFKGRRGPEGVALSPRAIRLFQAWKELSAPLRSFVPASVADDLWVYLDTQKRDGQPSSRLAVMSLAAAPKGGNKARRKISAELDLPTENSEQIALHASRIRTTYHNMLARRGWTGRTRIDPNHSTAVEGGHYVSAMTPAQEESAAAIIEQAQGDILRRARPPIVLTDEQAATFAAEYPQEIARFGLDEGEVAALLSSEMDMFTAACANQYAGVHGPAGKPCPARPWVCLLCPLAVFLPRHVPNLLRLKAYFARQSLRLTVDQFLAVFAPYADRLNHEILPRFDHTVLDAAACAVQDADSELPLRPEETTL